MGDIVVAVVVLVLLAMGGEATATATKVGGATTVLVNETNGKMVLVG